MKRSAYSYHTRIYDRFFLVFVAGAFAVPTPAPAVGVLALFLRADVDGFCGDNGSGDDEPTEPTADSLDDRLVMRGASAAAVMFDARDLRGGRRAGVGSGAISSSCSSSSD